MLSLLVYVVRYPAVARGAILTAQPPFLRSRGRSLRCVRIGLEGDAARAWADTLTCTGGDGGAGRRRRLYRFGDACFAGPERISTGGEDLKWREGAEIIGEAVLSVSVSTSMESSSASKLSPAAESPLCVLGPAMLLSPYQAEPSLRKDGQAKLECGEGNGAPVAATPNVCEGSLRAWDSMG